ncbi:class I SAM-dependent methyltransferase [Methylobacterium nodulans]|uniref:class I SAM-dependent methyltransferase n=1 Tax=Methylobacterium nodulans TaxID=114616 RepID=UPI001FCB5F02|nr:class I SAM-dependent methyltransferase [Methylobacterium nodulans]
MIAHYELERRLADRLRAASREDRAQLYAEVYAELFGGLPDHPQKHANAEVRAKTIAGQVSQLKTLLTQESVYLEVGCGTAAVPFALASSAKEVLGLDVTDVLIDYTFAPANFRFVRTSGVKVPLPDASIDLAHSDQLMEHLHVEDAEAQLAEIYRVLKPGGRYIMTTPSHITGPHDISVYFDDVATGFHMREYDYGSIEAMLRQAGFRRMQFPIVVRGRWLVTVPYPLLCGLERVVERLPSRLRQHPISHLVMGIVAVATK